MNQTLERTINYFTATDIKNKIQEYRDEGLEITPIQELGCYASRDLNWGLPLMFAAPIPVYLDATGGDMKGAAVLAGLTVTMGGVSYLLNKLANSD